MKFKMIGEIYDVNEAMRKRLKEVVSELSDEAANIRPGEDSWSIANIVEHIAIVEQGITGICQKLLSAAEAEAKTSDGTAAISAGFIEKAAKVKAKGTKFEAPERVKPKGTQTITESLLVLGNTRKHLNEMSERFETVQGTEFTFPHPFFGDMTAQDWLVLIGFHGSRHTNQIERILVDQNEAQD